VIFPDEAFFPIWDTSPHFYIFTLLTGGYSGPVTIERGIMPHFTAPPIPQIHGYPPDKTPKKRLPTSRAWILPWYTDRKSVRPAFTTQTSPV